MKRIMVVVGLALVLVVGATACQPSEPKMTITATPTASSVTCWTTFYIQGKVTPAGATPRVVLQVTSNHKWVDANASVGIGDPPTKATGTVNKSTGAYQIPWELGHANESYHFRVRSDGSGAVSPSFYVHLNTVDTCI